MAEWETVVGLEMHVELATDTKLFSAAPNRFGDEPNTNVTPVCLGLPGSLPVLNRRAVELAIRLGLALGCEIRPSVFARKNYFYPDMPKDFQISQYDRPICLDGCLELPSGQRVGIERAHLEEDTGKSTHVGGAQGRIHGSDFSLIDYNRAGVPLLEIVSRPDLRSAEQAREYAEELRAVLVATGVSDARMEEGSMRCDANVSVRPAGSDELRTRCEIKNLNSFRSLTRAISYEAERHIQLYESGREPEQETRHFSDDGRTHTLRSKEESHDYRYFPEPDLVTLDPEPAWVERIRAELPPLPAARRRVLVERLGADPADAGLLVRRELDKLVLGAVEAGADAPLALTRAVHELGDGAGRLEAAAFARLVDMEAGGELTPTQAKDVLAVLVAEGGDPDGVARAKGYEAMDSGALETLVDQVIADNPDAWQRFAAGEDRVQGVFVGAVMKATQGQADGREVTRLLQARRARCGGGT
jgi:aspartyl-tRNA(Asn)/glutamyl-tRNA(Gln) amidotransferase subunit B